MSWLMSIWPVQSQCPIWKVSHLIYTMLLQYQISPAFPTSNPTLSLCSRLCKWGNLSWSLTLSSQGAMKYTVQNSLLHLDIKKEQRPKTSPVLLQQIQSQFKSLLLFSWNHSFYDSHSLKQNTIFLCLVVFWTWTL